MVRSIAPRLLHERPDRPGAGMDADVPQSGQAPREVAPDHDWDASVDAALDKGQQAAEQVAAKYKK